MYFFCLHVHIYVYVLYEYNVYVCMRICMYAHMYCIRIRACVCMNVCWFACDSLCVVAVILCAATFRAGATLKVQHLLLLFVVGVDALLCLVSGSSSSFFDV